MSDVERRIVCADGDLDLDRGRLSVAAHVGDDAPSVATKKRPRSRSRSPSAQATAKLIRKSAAEKRHRAVADEEASNESTRPQEDVFVVGHERSDAQGKGNPGTADLPIASRASIDGTSSLAKDDDQSNHGNAPKVALEQSLDQLRLLSQEASDLGLQQQRNMLAAERLQERLTRSERTYGELLRESLELQRAIEDRRKQIKTDKQELEKEQTSARATGDRLCTVLATMKELSQAISLAEANRGKRDMTS